MRYLFLLSFTSRLCSSGVDFTVDAVGHVWVVWVWGALGIDWLLGDSGGVGVPGGVSWVSASLVVTGGLVGVGAVVGLWGWGSSLEPSPAIETEELVIWLLHVHLSEVLEDISVVVALSLLFWELLVELVILESSGWNILVESNSGGGADKGSNSKLHLQIQIII